MVIHTLNYTRKEINVDYDEDKDLLDKLIESGQVQPLGKKVQSISCEYDEYIKIGPTFRFESKNELTPEDTSRIVQTYVHRKANYYLLNVEGKVATLKSFADPKNIKLVELPNNDIAIYA